MKRILLLLTILSVSVMTTACINNLAIQELNNKAKSYIDKGDAETAICRLKSSLELDDNVYQTHYNLGAAYNDIGKYEEAIEELNKSLELKPDFVEPYYIIAMAKEAIAYRIVEKEPDESGIIPEPTLDELADFNNKAADAVDTYNQYLVKKPDAPEADKINEKIAELNKKIKEYTDIYDGKITTKDKQIQEELESAPVSQNIQQETAEEQPAGETAEVNE